MSRPRFAAVVAAFLAALPGGCGWVEIRSPVPRPQVARPAPAAPARAAPVERAVVVAEGDTLYGLAQRHRVSARGLIEANRLSPPYRLVVGQRLVLPREGVHVVERGDTLYAISRAYGVDTFELARANGIGAPYTILEGQRLRIPGEAAPASAAPPPTPAPAETVSAPEPLPPPTLAPSDKVSAPESSPPPAAGGPPSRQPAPAEPALGAAPDASPPAVAAPPPAPDVAPARTVAPTPPSPGGRGFVWPVKGEVVSGFGPKAKGLHNDGINIRAARGAAVRAAENGTVAYVGNELRGFGNLLLVKHADGWVSAYAHADDVLVKRGDRVTRGQVIARVGSTGNVREPQLHFELRKGKRAVDPEKVLGGGRA